jgi:hypothetical protein
MCMPHSTGVMCALPMVYWGRSASNRTNADLWSTESLPEIVN